MAAKAVTAEAAAGAAIAAEATSLILAIVGVKTMIFRLEKGNLDDRDHTGIAQILLQFASTIPSICAKGSAHSSQGQEIQAQIAYALGQVPAAKMYIYDGVWMQIAQNFAKFWETPCAGSSVLIHEHAAP